MDFASSMPLGQSQAPLSFNQKWELHKPLLERLYLDESLSLPKIKEMMRADHDFDAETHQYKYRFDKWGWKKSISSSKKDAILKISQKREQQGLSTAVTYKGRMVASKKLQRRAKMMKEPEYRLFSDGQWTTAQKTFLHHPLVGGRFGFLNWNLPRNAMMATISQQVNHASPFGGSMSTPSDVMMTSPPAAGPSSPGLSQALLAKTKAERGHLFVTGRFDELLKSLDGTERDVLSTWSYQFWFFAFKTAKYWGRGPRNWTAENLWPDSDASMLSPSSSSLQLSNAPSPSFWTPETRDKGKGPLDTHHRPTSLCRWTIHVKQNAYLEEAASDLRPAPEVGLASNEEWPEAWKQPSFEDRLRDNVEKNKFSTIETHQLPIAFGSLVKAVQKSSDEIFLEALGFAIMGRNSDLVVDLLTRKQQRFEDSLENGLSHLKTLYPYHLAATYLDGSRTCCYILSLLADHVATRPDLPIREMWVDNVGHTVLDTLMITILRNHSTVRPKVVDDTWRDVQNFAGSEVDICGRWDADSECYQLLCARGHTKAPLNWKHKFCHTSTQALCHSIAAIGRYDPVVLGKPSGLFLKICFNCGMRLETTPLHTLVLTAFYLGQFGSKDEDLFGMICCLLCYFTAAVEHGPPAKAELSIALFQEESMEDGCSHEALSPASLADKLTPFVMDQWNSTLRTGWKIFSKILESIEQEYEQAGSLKSNENTADFDSLSAQDLVETVFWGDDSLDGQLTCEGHYDMEIRRSFGQNKLLGHIWAALQVELLNYRRLEDGQSWLSDGFSMDCLLQSLEQNDRALIPYLSDNVMLSYCACGNFTGFPNHHLPPRREQVCTHYFSNLDDWHRTHFLDDEVIEPDEGIW